MTITLTINEDGSLEIRGKDSLHGEVIAQFIEKLQQYCDYVQSINKTFPETRSVEAPESRQAQSRLPHTIPRNSPKKSSS